MTAGAFFVTVFYREETMKRKWTGRICIAVSAVFLAMAACSELPYWKNSENMKRIRAECTRTQTGETSDPDLERQIDFAALQKTNPDIAAWIYIPDTPVDYPVLKNPYDDHYLYRDYAGEYNPAGSIFMRAAAAADFSGNHTILYGHNMIDGQMFGWLKNYRDVENISSHPYIYIYLPERKQALRWQVYSAYQCHDATETYRTVFEDAGDYKTWQEMTVRLGEAAMELKPEDRILTLSTCTDSGSERYTVHGVLQFPETEK